MSEAGGVARGGARPRKRSFTIAGHRTSISLEAAFWDALAEIAEQEGRSRAHLIAEIDEARAGAGLSSAVRVWILDYLRREIRRPATPTVSERS